MYLWSPPCLHLEQLSQGILDALFQLSESMKILVISDKKPGHYNQSLGIVRQLEDADCKVVEIEHKTKRRDNLLRAIVFFFGWFKLPPRIIWWLLKMSLRPESVEKLLNCNNTDIVLSTGSSVAAVNLLMGKLLNAKTVACSFFSPQSISAFDLVILPQFRHPRINRKNVVKLIGVPNKFTPQLVQKKQNELDAIPDGRIGVLLGGEAPHYTISKKTASCLLDALIAVSEEIDGEIALTTSRRTPDAVETLIEKRLSNSDRTALLVTSSIGTDIPEPVETIFATCEIIVVTEDSLSMVCEAASSGRKVVILEIDRKTGKPHKHESTYESIMEMGVDVKCSVDELKDILISEISKTLKREALQDAKIAARAIARLV